MKKKVSLTLTDANRNALLLSTHRAIEETAVEVVDALLNGRSGDIISYPPNGGLTETEQRALAALPQSEELKSALRKVFADQAAAVVFNLFSIIDGVSEPNPETNNWTEVLLIDKPVDYDEYAEFLHDDFYGTYWDWRKQREDIGWKLDLLD